jgi:hypothetical protein
LQPFGRRRRAIGPRAIWEILRLIRGLIAALVATTWIVASPVAVIAGVAGPCTITGYQSSETSFPNKIGDASASPQGFSPADLTTASDWRVSTSKNLYFLGRSSTLTHDIRVDVELFSVRWPILSGHGYSRQAVSRAWDMNTISRLARALGLHAQTAGCDANLRLVVDESPFANVAGAGGILAALIGGIGLARVAFRRRGRASLQGGGKSRSIYRPWRRITSVVVGAFFGLTAGLGQGLYMQQAGNISPFDQRTLWFPMAGVVLGVLAGLLGGRRSAETAPVPADSQAAATRQIGKYRLQARVGDGYSGTVYLAWDEVLERRVAIKELEPAFLKEPRLLKRFREEAQTMAQLDHPNCVQVYDFFESAEGAYLVSEYIDGASLREVITHSGRLSPEQALGVLKGGLSGLAHAHGHGLVHRDVKPENILCDLQGVSKLADFGLAIFTSEDANLEGPSAGTPHYMSPEQAGGEPLDRRSDIYSAGAVLFELLTGQPPYAGGNNLAIMRMHAEQPVPEPRQVNPRLPEAVAEVVTKAMAKDPADRHQTADDFISALTAAAAEGYGSNWEEKASLAAVIGGVVAAGGSAASSAASSAGVEVSTTGAGAVAAAVVGSAAVVAATTAATARAAGAPSHTGGGGLLAQVPIAAQVVAGVTGAVLVLGAATIVQVPPVTSPPAPPHSPTAPEAVLVETSASTAGQGPVTVHWVALDGRELASQDLPANEAVIGAGGSRLLVYRSDGHVLDLHTDGSSDDVGSGMPANTAPVANTRLSPPFRTVVSPDGNRWIWSKIVGTPNLGTLHSQMWLSRVGQTPTVVADATESDHWLVPNSWRLANPLIAHQALGVGGYLLFAYDFGAVDQLDLTSGKQTPFGPADAAVVDVARNGAVGYIQKQNQSHTLVVTRPGLRDLSFALAISDQAGDVLFDPGSTHLVFATSPLVGNAGGLSEQYETDIIDLNTGARTKLDPAGIRPAGWTPDGRLIAVRPNGAAGGPIGTYLVSISGRASQLTGFDGFYGLELIHIPPRATASTNRSAAPPTPAGPYASLQAADAYVRTYNGGNLGPLAEDVTWRTASTLHVIHATPTNSASYGGDFYFFFVNGDVVGKAYFTSAQTDTPVDDATFAVSYKIYLPNDGHCCPSGGFGTARYQWDGSKLVPLDAIQGQDQSNPSLP